MRIVATAVALVLMMAGCSAETATPVIATTTATTAPAGPPTTLVAPEFSGCPPVDPEEQLPVYETLRSKAYEWMFVDRVEVSPADLRDASLTGDTRTLAATLHGIEVVRSGSAFYPPEWESGDKPVAFFHDWRAAAIGALASGSERLFLATLRANGESGVQLQYVGPLFGVSASGYLTTLGSCGSTELSGLLNAFGESLDRPPVEAVVDILEGDESLYEALTEFQYPARGILEQARADRMMDDGVLYVPRELPAEIADLDLSAQIDRRGDVARFHLIASFEDTERNWWITIGPDQPIDFRPPTEIGQEIELVDGVATLDESTDVCNEPLDGEDDTQRPRGVWRWTHPTSNKEVMLVLGWQTACDPPPISAATVGALIESTEALDPY